MGWRANNAASGLDMYVVAIILNYKHYEQTIRCVRKLLEQDYGALYCIVVDNASPNDSLPQLKEALEPEERVTILPTSSNKGYAAGNNIGVRWAITNYHPEYILIINPDVVISDKSLITKLVSFAESQPDAGAISPKVILPDGFVQGPYKRPSLPLNCIRYLIPIIWFVQRGTHQRWIRTQTLPIRCFRTIGACMLLRTDSFEGVGMFDEGTFLENEEPILAELLRRRGKYFYHLPSVMVVHYHNRKGESEHTMTSMKHYFKEYRGASNLAIDALELCSKFYERFYLPLKRRLPITQ